MQKKSKLFNFFEIATYERERESEKTEKCFQLSHFGITQYYQIKFCYILRKKKYIRFSARKNVPRIKI